MKNYPLSIQIWLVIAIITLTISASLAFILPRSLQDFFTKEIYASISAAQDLVFNQFEGNIYRDYIGSDFFVTNEEIKNNIRTVKHLIIYDTNKVILDDNVPMAFIQKIKDQAQVQKNSSVEYSMDLGGEKIFYIISKGKALGLDAFFVSYMGDSYREDLVRNLFSKLISIVLIILLLSWIPALLLSRYLSRPLVDLERRVEKLAQNQWSEPIDLNRKDEIGRLGYSIDHLRKQLIRQDESEQSFLQHVSHELKTPVMVIQSYTEAIKDGIYPKGSLDLSLDVISDEGKRLEKKIRNLLYLTKLNYLSSHDTDYRFFSLTKLVEDTIDKLSISRPDLIWDLSLEEASIKGDPDQWILVVENLLDNQIRYARSKVEVSIKRDVDKLLVEIGNDGPPVEEMLLNKMFDKYYKGDQGEFGLGLAIVHKIVLGHGANIFCKNQENGVAFYIEIIQVETF